MKCMYFVKEGTVTLLEQAPARITLDQRLGTAIESEVDQRNRQMPLLSSNILCNPNYREIGIRQKGQIIGEEYLYIKTPSAYKAMISSEKAILVMLKFSDIEYNLKSHEWYRAGRHLSTIRNQRENPSEISSREKMAALSKPRGEAN